MVSIPVRVRDVFREWSEEFSGSVWPWLQVLVFAANLCVGRHTVCRLLRIAGALTLISKFYKDANLYDPSPKRQPGHEWSAAGERSQATRRKRSWSRRKVDNDSRFRGTAAVGERSPS